MPNVLYLLLLVWQDAGARILLADMGFMAGMFIVIMIASCFLGRQVVIKRKMVIAAAGIVVVHFVFSIMELVYFKYNSTLTGETNNEDLMKVWMEINYVFSLVSSVAAYVFAFVFYFLSFKEKRFWRAVESTVCLYLYHLYTGVIILFTYAYYNGGEYDLISKIIYEYGDEYYYFKKVQAVLLFCFGAVLVLWLYFGFFRKKVCYRLRLRARILFVVWMVAGFCGPAFPICDEELTSVQQRYEIVCRSFGCLVPVFGMLAPAILILSASRRFLKEKSDHQEKYLEAELEYVKRYKDSQTQTRAFRHDIANHLTLTNMLMENGKLDEAKEHLQELLGSVQALSPRFVTGDEMLDCIVSMKAEKMEELGIAFTLDGVVDGGLGMKPMDVCAVFANALDNAIEAAQAVDPSMKPSISMQLRRTPQFFVIKIKNSAKGKIDAEKLFAVEGYTTKRDAQSHGFGLRNIHQHVEIYDGMIKAESTEDAFALSIMIPKGDDGGSTNGGETAKEEKKYA